MMSAIEKLKAVPVWQKYRYVWIIFTCLVFFAPLALIPAMVGSSDFCGVLCMRRFFLYFPGMTWDDFLNQTSVAAVGAGALITILAFTFCFGRIWCSFLCPVGGFTELVSRSLNDRWKIEFRSLPQVQIRYGYFLVYLLLMPALGISACTLCNFITIPRIFQAFSGGVLGVSFLLSSVGLVNIALLFILGFFASKGRAYCQFLCPIGAIDALVNRLGAHFDFACRIRIDRDRCSGCNVCAKACMTGAIKMVDRVAVVDQLSCMSCHECVDVCEWNALQWSTAHKNHQPKRIKKGVEIHPQPEWQAIQIIDNKKNMDRSSKQEQIKERLKKPTLVVMISGALLALSYLSIDNSYAEPRVSDPDGCLVCHDMKGLDFVDENGLQRSASIDLEHYSSSLHGSVACSDCHAEVKEYPHKPENAVVDCAASCHLEEPSSGESYSHKEVVEEFEKSVHGDGWTRSLSAANRLQETKEELSPSCRRCHSNSLYINEEQQAQFQELFNHTDTECGGCHQGKAWRNQFGGHLLRRFLAGRWSKPQLNQLCIDCHDDSEMMHKVEIEQSDGTVKAADKRFISAVDSYQMTLHGKMLANNDENGASCIDCHAPKGFGHAIHRDDNPEASTHHDNLIETCGSSECHGYADNENNKGFLHTDQHDLDFVLPSSKQLLDLSRAESFWWRSLWVFIPALIIFVIGSFYWLFRGERKKTIIPVLGGEHFQQEMLGLKPRKKKYKSAKIGAKKIKGEGVLGKGAAQRIEGESDEAE